MKLQEEINCLPTSTHLAESEPLAKLAVAAKRSKPSRISTSTRTPKQSTATISQNLQYTAISETITHAKESTSILVDSLVPTQAAQEIAKGLTEASQNSGLNICESSKRESLNSPLSKIPQDYSIAEWEQSYKAYPKAGICVNGRLSALPCLAVPKKGSEYSSLPIPTLTTGLGSGRDAGATRSEKWLKDKKLLLSTQALNPQIMALLFAFPMDWAACLSESPRAAETETQLEPCLDAPSISIARSPLSNESSISATFSANNIDAELESLLEQRDRLIAQGASPEGIWINCGKVSGKDFKQAVWKSSKPRSEWGDKKSCYIGKYGKEEHLSAIAQHKAGQELRKIEKQIKKLQVKS